MGTLAVETKPLLLFHCCTGKGAKTKLHQEYPHRKKRIPLLSRKLVFFANRNTQKNMPLLDKIHTVFTAALRQGLKDWQNNVTFSFYNSPIGEFKIDYYHLIYMYSVLTGTCLYFTPGVRFVTAG